MLGKGATKTLTIFQQLYGKFNKIFLTTPSPREQVVSLKPKGTPRGNVLLSYRIERFLIEPGQPIPYCHYSSQLSVVMASIFVDLGFAVDIIANTNGAFSPKKDYSFFIDTRMNFERIANVLNKDCVKIFHATTAHPYFNNYAETKRLMEMQERRHVTLRSRRSMDPKHAMAIEFADCVVVHCAFGLKNFNYANKPMYLVPNAVPYRYPWSDAKDFEACRSRFLWLGSEGMVHKGLDLVLEAFAGMPEYHLTVCGPVAREKDFEQAYFQELYHTPNIHTHGWIDVESTEFTELTNHCLGLVYPSCSETNAGSVLTCLHAGLIPIISYESGVDVGKDAGIVLDDCSIEAIQEAVRQMATASTQELKQRSRIAWEFARANHTMENFEKQYKKMVVKIMADSQK
ncbi:MAG: glycosyltransferase [Nitrospirota bacterium]